MSNDTRNPCDEESREVAEHHLAQERRPIESKKGNDTAKGMFGAKSGTSPPDPAEVTLTQEADASGRIAAARDVVRRHACAHGREDPYPTSPEEREKRCKAALAQLDAAFGSRFGARVSGAAGRGLAERVCAE